jgi:hypothetical protein
LLAIDKVISDDDFRLTVSLNFLGSELAPLQKVDPSIHVVRRAFHRQKRLNPDEA